MVERVTTSPAGFRIHLTPEQIAASDEYAEADPYDVERSLETDFHRRRIELTLQLVRRAMEDTGQAPAILDIGCGEGHITAEVHRAFPGADVHGFDYSISAIEHAVATYPGIEFSVADAYAAPYPDARFDIVICNNVWEHVPDPLRLLAEMRRVLKPGGFVIFSTPSRYRLGNLIRIATGRPVQMMSSHHVTEYTVGQVKEQLAFGGFETICALSRPYADDLVRRVVKTAIRTLLSVIGSHHELEATIFYLARRKDG